VPDSYLADINRITIFLQFIIPTKMLMADKNVTFSTPLYQVTNLLFGKHEASGIKESLIKKATLTFYA